MMAATETPPENVAPIAASAPKSPEEHSNKRKRSMERRDSFGEDRPRSPERKRLRAASPEDSRKKSSDSGRDYGTRRNRLSPQRYREDSYSPERNTDRSPARNETLENVTQREKGAQPSREPRTGGVYIPPFKLAMMRKEIKDKSSAEYQRMTWDALKKSINGLINKVNVTNIKNIIPELFAENIIRGRGLLARSLMRAQLASPNFTNVYAALIAVVNTKMPALGELLLKRVLVQFLKSYKRNDKHTCLASTKFIAHLVNQQVAGEIVALQVLALLLEHPTDDSVEVAVGFVKECGAVLSELSPEGFNGVFDRLRAILHEGDVDLRTQYIIEDLFMIRKTNFAQYPGIVPELDLVEPDEQVPHDHVDLDADLDVEEALDYFQLDDLFEQHEVEYEAIKREILGGDEDEEGRAAGEGEDHEYDEEEQEEEQEEQQQPQPQQPPVIDSTDAELTSLKRRIYLTVMSSLDFEECAHKLLKLGIPQGHERELCNMLLECCSQERTYLRYYGLLGERFCRLGAVYVERFDECFAQWYATIHRLETNKLRNVAKFFAHLLHSDALPWTVLGYIRLSEETTTSSSRIFIKILFQELAEFLGLRKLRDRLLADPEMAPHFEGLFPRDHPRNTRFAINFFTAIGLAGLTTELRDWLRSAPKMIAQQNLPPAQPKSSSPESSESSSSSPSSSASSSSESGDSASSSSESESDRRPRPRRAEAARKEPTESPARRHRDSATRRPAVSAYDTRERTHDREHERTYFDRDSGRGEREREKDRDRDRDRDRETERERDRERERERERERDRDREREYSREERHRVRSRDERERRRSPEPEYRKHWPSHYDRHGRRD